MVNLPKDHVVSTLTVKIPRKVRVQLEKLSGTTGKTESSLAVEAISNYLLVQSWQIHATKQSVKRADTQDVKFVDHHRVVEWVQSWGSEGESGIVG